MVVSKGVAFELVGRTLFPVLVILLLQVNLSSSRRHTYKNFVSSSVLPDGEVETVVHYKGITAKERTAGTASNWTSVVEEKQPTKGYVLWQVTDGRHFLQMIFDNKMNLWDCDYITDKESVKKFLSETHNHTKNQQHFKKLTPQLRKITSYKSLKKQCKQLHKFMKKHLKHKSKRNQSKNKRTKRGIFIYPGTNFCGVGSSDNNRTVSRSDRCCRDHDHCPYMIEGWSTKFNLFNYRFHTLSHCHCDERFRACLKQISSSTANMIGYLYFNVVKMKCFIFKKEKTCSKRSWWGSCAKYEESVAANLKDPTEY